VFKRQEPSSKPDDPETLFYLTRLDLSYNELRDQACRNLSKLFVIITPEDVDDRREKERKEKASNMLKVAEDEYARQRSEVERLEAAALEAAEEAAKEEAMLRELEEGEHDGSGSAGSARKMAPAALAAQEATEALKKAQDDLQLAEQAVEDAAADLDRPAPTPTSGVDAEKASLRPKPAVSQLILAGNLLGNGGCALLGRALGQRGSRLEVLDLSATNVGNEGLILLANGILKASSKYQTKTLRRLLLGGCPLTLGSDTVKVLSRLISRTGLRELDVSGCLLEGGVDLSREKSGPIPLQASQTLAASSSSVTTASQVGSGMTNSSSPEALSLARQLSEALDLRIRMCYDESGTRISTEEPCILGVRGCGFGKEAEAAIQSLNMKAEKAMMGRGPLH